MRALVLNALNQALQLSELPDLQPQPGEAVVRLHAAALNHRDVYITQGKYAGIELPCILGSDGAGEYEGRRVLIFPSLSWGDDPRAHGKQFRVLGMPDPGTFAEQIAVPLNHLYPVPEHLSWEEAAALPLAGLTAWRILMTRCQLRPGERVLISGIGGGVALFALQFAVAMGAEVWVTSSRPDKVSRAVALGAKGGADYRTEGWDRSLKTVAGGFDVVIDAAGGDGFAAFAGLCNPGGRIGIYGGTAGRINGLSPQIVFWKHLSIFGSSMGDATDFQQMLDFVSRHAIRPVIDAAFPLAEGNAALHHLAEGGQFGKVVLRIAQ